MAEPAPAAWRFAEWMKRELASHHNYRYTCLLCDVTFSGTEVRAAAHLAGASKHGVKVCTKVASNKAASEAALALKLLSGKGQELFCGWLDNGEGDTDSDTE